VSAVSARFWHPSCDSFHIGGPLLTYLFSFFFLSLLGVLHASCPSITEAVLKALCLCDNLYSFTWIDDTSVSPAAFLSFLEVLRGLPLRAITLRTFSNLGEDAWTLLNTFANLQKVAIWCMNGPPCVLQGWAPLLGSTLTELELGVCIHFVRDPHHIFMKGSIHAM
jgi:hypothetical protein